MFSRRGLWAAAGLLLIGLGLGYGRLFPSKAKTSGPAAICLLPFTNLSNDPAWDWMSDAGPLMVAAQLEGQPGVRVGMARSVAEAAAQGWAEVAHVTFRADGGRWETALTREELSGHTMLPEQQYRGSSATGGLIWAARMVGGGRTELRPLPTRSVEAMRLFATQNFQDAARADSSFLMAWRGLAETRLRSGDRSGARQAIAQALEANPKLEEREKLGLKVLDAQAAGDPGKLADATLGWAQANPGVEGAQLTAAAAATQARRFEQASKLYETALRLNPANAEAWNLLGYARGYGGDLKGAAEAFASYAAKAPNSANPLDSAGEILLRAGRFAEAEKKFLEAVQKQPDFLDGYCRAKAAFARYLSGDTSGASKLFEEYLKVVGAKSAPIAGLQRAVWQRATGNEKDARAALAQAGKPGQNLALLWDVEEGKGPAGALPEGFRLLAQKKFGEAAEYWRKAYDAAGPSADSQAREMLAWCLVETGKKAEAAELLKVWSFPSQPAEMFTPFFYWPRTFRLREAVGSQARSTSTALTEPAGKR